MVIFLDFDGVITTDESWITQDDHIDQRALGFLQELLQKRSCQIVVTSTWRSGHSLAELRQILAPLETEVIDVTPVLSNRGEEIITWLSQHSVGEGYLIIDDEVKEIRPYIDDEHIVHVRNGFTEGGFGSEHLQQALRLIDHWEPPNAV